jgi:hypothetical protein
MATDAFAPLRRSLDTMFPLESSAPRLDAGDLLSRAVETMAAVAPKERDAEAAFLAGNEGDGIASGPLQVAARRHLWQVAGAVATAREAWGRAFLAGHHAAAHRAQRQWRNLLAEGLDALEADALMVAAFMPSMAATGMCPAPVPPFRPPVGTACRTTKTPTRTRTATRRSRSRRPTQGRP